MTIVQDVESRINILDIVNRYVQTRKAGTNYKGLCPFHTEKTPSFVVSPNKNMAYCFGCHRGWGPVKFLSEIEKIPFGEALHILAAEAGIEMKTDYNREHGEKTMSFYDMYKVAEHFYHQELLAPQNKDKLAYLTDRGLSDETIRLFKLGYSGNPRDLFYALKSKGYEEKMILESGIFVSPSRDKFFGRIVFPIANYVGNTVAFTGRVLDKSEPKYINSPASDIFDKSSILYGLHLAKSTISKKNHAIIVEGQMDTISLHQAGINEAVGISGTALTKEHIHLLKRLTHNIYLCLDSDEAGTKATFASIENLLNENVNVYVIRVPDGKDPDEFIRNGGDFQACIDQASSLIDFYLDVGTRRTDVSTPEGKKNMVRSLFAILEKIHSRIEIDDYLKRISKRLDIHISALYDELRIGRKNEKALAPDTHKTFTLEERIVGYISHFGYQNLFLENFPYNEFRRAENPFFSFLSTYLENYQERLSESWLDLEHIRAIELFIEQENEHASDELIKTRFIELIHRLKKEWFEAEKKAILAPLNPKSEEYLLAYQKMSEKAKRLGIKK